jgi:hypothetical protein
MEKSGLSAFKLIVIFQYLSYQLQSRTSLKENGKKCCVAVFRKKKPDTRKKTVTCTVCKLNQPFSGNTTNMFPHLRLKHPDLYPKKTKTTRMPNRPIGLLKDEDHENEEVMSDIYQEDNGIQTQQ